MKFNPLFQDKAYTFYHITHKGESHETTKKLKEYQTWLKTVSDYEYTPDTMIMEIQEELKARSASKDAPVTPSTHGC